MESNKYSRDIRVDARAVWTGLDDPCEICDVIGKDGRGDHRFTARVTTEPGHDRIAAVNVCRIHAEQLAGKLTGSLLKFINQINYRGRR